MVIAAGYSKEMDRFISSNPGLASRFKTTIAFPDYEPAELVKIFEEICRANEVKLADTRARKKLKALVEAIYEQRGENWGNGREMRNLFETCIGNMAQRTAALHSVKNDDMSFIKAADIPDKL